MQKAKVFRRTTSRRTNTYDLATSQAKHGELELSELYRGLADKKKRNLASRMTTAEIAEAQKRAREWKPTGLTGRERSQ